MDNLYKTCAFFVIQARSERGSRRLPRERSSEISKNYRKNYHSYMRVEINQRRQNLGLKPVNLVRNFYVSNFNIHARGNKSVAAKFGPKTGKFGAKLLLLKFQHTYMFVEINQRRQNLGLKPVNLV